MYVYYFYNCYSSLNFNLHRAHSSEWPMRVYKYAAIPKFLLILTPPKQRTEISRLVHKRGRTLGLYSEDILIFFLLAHTHKQHIYSNYMMLLHHPLRIVRCPLLPLISIRTRSVSLTNLPLIRENCWCVHIPTTNFKLHRVFCDMNNFPIRPMH